MIQLDQDTVNGINHGKDEIDQETTLQVDLDQEIDLQVSTADTDRQLHTTVEIIVVPNIDQTAERIDVHITDQAVEKIVVQLHAVEITTARYKDQTAEIIDSIEPQITEDDITTDPLHQEEDTNLRGETRNHQ